MNKEGDWFFLGEGKFLCYRLFSWSSQRKGSPCGLALPWFIRSLRSRSGTKLQRDVKCVMERERGPNGAL